MTKWDVRNYEEFILTGIDKIRISTKSNKLKLGH